VNRAESRWDGDGASARVRTHETRTAQADPVAETDATEGER
jgi:hypothetical protein